MLIEIHALRCTDTNYERTAELLVRLPKVRYEVSLRWDGPDALSMLEAKVTLGSSYIKLRKPTLGFPLIKDAIDTSCRVFGRSHHLTQEFTKILEEKKSLFGPPKAMIIGLDAKPEINGKLVDVLRKTKDSKKYIVAVKISGKTKEFKAFPAQLRFEQGTEVYCTYVPRAFWEGDSPFI